ncbi:MAG: MBL fold metallo-hydrolase [Pelagibacteraceae bacterium]|jgi:glyoxylase-like metal-dependent hydrolase (beta-lactamase superfamily II)/rhodanese-related sulfurtransferase|nr:MBL fold metallo-hydrolase [Pelagibacteraceae bacterium]MDP6784531.1 MBL fold metallo-hydrolase [Alphaproteobacteria bacterium]MBO6467910.1 MBL fold metallo-hydrolase [Pelagibacteraceae bacterium]MBO6470495.1 MBL fold metallo-hydrolase [Pelagibacteraceae bacterium]MBO6471658.1 MBL fold metallo-hydrolase [Pelagibacteraceae bacterium]
MIFRQFFDNISSTYTYLISSGNGREAVIIDPVFENTDQYIQLLNQLELRLVKVIDTHIHADHVSGISSLRDKTKCVTVMGERAPGDVVSMRVKDNESVKIEDINLKAIYTPGHTDDSYSFLMNDRVFTGDALLIKGTGRTDFQNGSTKDSYNSLFERLLKLPEETYVYPAHDYKGESVSTIGEEKKFNPRLQVSSIEEYAQIMDNLKLDNPKQMDVAVPKNRNMGLSLEKQKQLKGITFKELNYLLSNDDCRLIDLREQSEIDMLPSLNNSIKIPFLNLHEYINSKKEELSKIKLIFYCAVGERSALAVQICSSYKLNNVFHLIGGLRG